MNKFPTIPGTLRPMAAAVFACMASSAFSQIPDATLRGVPVERVRPFANQNHLPVTMESVTAKKAAETANAMTVEDTLKYLPNILIRRRHIRDTQT